jgi:hypothetical protein
VLGCNYWELRTRHLEHLRNRVVACALLLAAASGQLQYQQEAADILTQNMDF